MSSSEIETKPLRHALIKKVLPKSAETNPPSATKKKFKVKLKPVKQKLSEDNVSVKEKSAKPQTSDAQTTHAPFKKAANRNTKSTASQTSSHANKPRTTYNVISEKTPVEKAPINDGARKSFKTTRRKQFSSKRDKLVEKNIQVKSKSKEVSPPVTAVPKSISIMGSISVANLAKKMNLKASVLLSKLMGMGTVVSINSNIDADTAQILASEYDCNVTIVSLYDQTIIETKKDSLEDLVSRAPIVTVMGHVDHGKTTLLDAIRRSDVAANEQGDITQHIGAYQVHVDEKPITFLDTPGHAAFSLMRARGAQVTDIVVLVIAANDSVNTQTKEAITLAKDAKVPIIVALNKMDSSSANPDKILQQLSDLELVAEEWGGDISVCKISALKGEGIDTLLETILLHSEMLELKANPNCAAEGKIIETRVEQGYGVVATVIVERGTLRVRDCFVAGIYSGKVRMLLNDKGHTVKEVTPSMPVEVVGLEGMPSAGVPFQVTEDEKEAKSVSIRRQELARHQSNQSIKKVTGDTLYSTIEAENISLYKVIIKGDVHGSVEAIKMAIEEIGNEEVKIQVVAASAGEINESDIMLATASEADIIGFHLKPSQKILKLAQQSKITIHRFTVIFKIIEKMKSIISSMLSPDIVTEKIGEVEIRNIFTVSKIGTIAGSYVQAGKVIKNAVVHVIRNNKKIAEDRIQSLKRFQDDANTVDTGYECGILLVNMHDLQVGDVIHIFEEKEVTKSIT